MIRALNRTVLLCAFFTFFVLASQALPVYVSANGSDKNMGSEQKPVATLGRALQLVRSMSDRKDVCIIVGDGTYYLSNTLVLTEEYSGITIKAQNPGRAVVSGGSLLKLKWKHAGKGVYVAKVRNVSDIDQLYVNGERQRMARYPNAKEESGYNVFDAWNLSRLKSDIKTFNPETDVLYKERVKGWKNPEGAYLHAMHNYLWGDMHWLVKGKTAKGDSLICEGGWQNNRPAPKHKMYRMIENVKEELDAPGEWYFDRRKSMLYYIPAEDVDVNSAKIEVVRLKHLFEIKGKRNAPVKNVNIEGLVFRHAARTFMENKERLLKSDWTVYRGGAVVYENAEDCNLTNCEFDQVGGNTIFVNKYNRRINISGCYIHDSGANGIAFVGDTAAVRNPKFNLSDRTLTDKTIGPRSDNYPADCYVYDCLITRTGRDEKQTAPIQISMSYAIRVNHCSIYDVPRAGINISEGTFGGHVIENCDVFNTVLETGDHGSFNSWGRDRYWIGDVPECTKFLKNNPGAEKWDMLGKNVIRHNRMRCDHGWDIDLDDGSSNYVITENLLLRGGLKLREGKNREVTNNIIVNNSLHPHVWYQNSGDIFTRNIVCTPYRPALMNVALGSDGKWGWQIDFNFFGCTRDAMLRYARNGCDANSLCGNPQFVDPASGNYKVSETSDALKTGFHNFDMDNFGVVSPRLKAIAKQPDFPMYKYVGKNDKTTGKYFTWKGGRLLLATGNALSAYGMDLNAVGLSVDVVPTGGNVAKCGMRVGDLILQINGKPLTESTDINSVLSSEITSLQVARNQEKLLIKIKP